MFDYLMSGGVFVKPNFFDVDDFNDMKNDLDKLSYDKTYQPDTYYGNRLQAFPCYESDYNEHKQLIINSLQGVLKKDIIDLKILARKTLMSEVKQSKADGKYGFIHRDIDDNKIPMIAGMMYFDQSFDGGTAFFENHWDKVPDIYISAYPNRLVLYNANRWHAPAFDYTFEERKTLSFFATIGQK
jgi:hypothetical protein